VWSPYRRFYSFAKDIEKIVPDLLVTLASQPSDDSKSARYLADTQALAKQLADLLDFALRFDHTRMMRPILSNDFSYYRRLLPKFSKHPDVKVKDDDASGMALFTAEHTPMMTALSRAAARALERNEYVTTALAVLANSCLKMLKAKKFTKPDSALFVARAMTGAIVLYDHAHALGSFHKRSPIAIKACILLLKKDFPKEQSLLGALQYSTKNFKNAPPNIAALFK